MGNQNSGNVAVSHAPATWTQSFPRENKKLKKYGALNENKVLPERIPGQRLRPTENGHILQTKGTITARRMSEFHAPHHPAFPPPLPLHQPHNTFQQPYSALRQPHSASMTALHHPHIQDERANSIHELRFGRPPSKNYMSEPDLRGPSPQMAINVPQPHTIISQSPTKGRIKSKKKYKAPPVPQEPVADYPTSAHCPERVQFANDTGTQSPQGQYPNQWSVHWAANPPQTNTSHENQKPKTRKIGLFRKKNESRRPSSREEQHNSNEDPERVRAISEDRRAVISPIRRSPRDELRERARSLDSLQHELRQSPVSPAVPMAATSLTHLHQPQEPRLWVTLERESRHSIAVDVLDSRRSSTIERDSRRSSTGDRDSRRVTTLEREHQKSHRRMSTLERKVEDRKHWNGEVRDNTTPSSSTRRLSRIDSYRDGSSHRRSSSSGSHHELIPEEVEHRDAKDEWDRAEVEIMKQKKSEEKTICEEWGMPDAQVTQRKKMPASFQAELISTVKNLKKSENQDSSTSALVRKVDVGIESSKHSNHNETVMEQNESQPKTFFFGMNPEVSSDPRSETNTGLHKIKNQEKIANTKNQEEVRIKGQTVEYSRRTLERMEKKTTRNHTSHKESQKVTESQQRSVDEVDNSKAGDRNDRRKLTRDVEEFAVAIERHKMNRADGESGASGSSRREDGGYHSRQNSGSLYLDNEQDDRTEGELSMNLRPTLPRRQLEIPRFSPNAAWRSLSLERASRHPEPLNESQSSEEPDSVYEARIQRFTRPTAPPRGSGEKSADSGISGDAGSPGPTHEFEPLTPPEKTKSSSGPLAASSPVASGRPEVRRAWTPAEDLDDNSLDGSGEQPGIPEGLSTPPKLTSRSNMFQKPQKLTAEPETEPESPTETEPISELVSADKIDHWSRRKKHTGGDIIPHKFNSLRKLKRSVSGAISGLGRKSPPNNEESHWTRSPEEPHIQQQGDETNWRDNWSMSRSIPNSLNTCEEHDTASNLSSSRNVRSRSESRIGTECGEDSRPRTPAYLQYGNSGHIMYLPQYNSRRMIRGEAGSEDESDKRVRNSSLQRNLHHSHHSVRPLTPEQERKPPSGDEDPALPETYHGPSSLPANLPTSHSVLIQARKGKSKKFSYQSTVRILEKKKLEEKLAKEVAEKEKLRLKEMEAMKKVEEEFQRKREREKKKLKQQLKIFHIQQQQQQQQQPTSQHTNRDLHNNSYSSDDQGRSSYSSEQHEVSSQDSSHPPPLPRSSPPQVYPAFTSLPVELPREPSPGLLSGLKSWVRGRRESRSSSTSTNTLTSAPRQEPDGAPASSPRKSNDDYSGGSSPSSRKNSEEYSSSSKPNIRAEIIAASRKRSGDHESPDNIRKPQHKTVYSYLHEVSEQEALHQNHSPNNNYSRHQMQSKYKKDDLRRSQSPESRRISRGSQSPENQWVLQRSQSPEGRRMSRRSKSPESRRATQALVQELPELHQERREYREYRSPSRHSHSPPARPPNSPPASITPSKSSSNYRRDFCRGNAQVIGPNVVSVKMKRSDESDRYSKHSSEDRRSVSSSGVQRSASVDLLETGSCSSSSTARHHHSSHHLADASLSHNYNRLSGYPAVASSPARFAHSMLTPFNPARGYKPVSFSPPPPTKILHVN